MKRGAIGWCDYSGGDLNFVIRGKNCPVSPGCAHCYVERDFARYRREMALETTIYPEKLRRLARADFIDGGMPFRRGPGSRPVAFPCDYGDLFHDDVPAGFIMEALLIMAGRDDVDWAVLTKRVRRLGRMVDRFVEKYGPLPPNIWCIASVEDQQRADERIPALLQVKARVLGVSMEPMLGPIDIQFYLDGCPRQVSCRQYVTREMAIDAGCPEMEGDLYSDDEWEQTVPSLNWIIVGAESGPDRRPFGAGWALNAYEQCRAAGVPFFGKQDSGRPGVPLALPGYGEVKQWPR